MLGSRLSNMSIEARNIVEALFEEDANLLKDAIVSALNSRKQQALESFKSEYADELLFDEEIEDEELDEAKSATGKRLAKVSRIRGGVVQRRKTVTQKKGYKIVGGKVKRMSPLERKRRAMSQKKAARKRRGTMARSLKKRARSLRIRKSRGL